MELNYKEMGKRITLERKKLNLTQEKLAEKVEVAPSYISEIERGTSICSLAVLVKIATELNLNFDYLIVGVNDSNVEGKFKKLLNEIPEENHKLFIDLCDNIASVLSENK